MSRITLQKAARLTNVAAAAGVSKATASNVFNRPDVVREDVRLRVLDVARSMGFRGPDMLEIVKDKAGLEKLRALVAGNVSPSPLAVSKAYASQYQTVKASTITFALDEFKKQAQVTSIA